MANSYRRLPYQLDALISTQNTAREIKRQVNYRQR